MQNGYFNQMFDSKKDFLKPVYFKIDVLERYFKDPKFLVFYSDYRGSIALKDEHVQSDDLGDYEHIRDFGLAYSKGDNSKRAVVTFADDLIKMPVKVQGYWSYYLVDNQSDYFPNDGFVKNLILGEWVDEISIYNALLMELHYINEMCKAISVPPMFRQEYSYNDLHQSKRPTHYHSILLPTRENYFNFVNTLEKITTSNINIKTFLSSAPLVKITNRTYIEESGNERQKGSVMMLGDWFEKNVVGTPNLQKEVIEPLKMLVKLRQTPAHKLYENEYDESIWGDQNELIQEVYTAIRNIRLLLANHPSAKTVSVPKELFEGIHIRIY